MGKGLGPGQGCVQAASKPQWGYWMSIRNAVGKNMATSGPRDTPRAWPRFTEALLTGGLRWGRALLGCSLGGSRVLSVFSLYFPLPSAQCLGQVFPFVSVSAERLPERN